MRIIYGAGGHGTVVLDTVRAMGIEPDGFVDDGRIGQTICGLPVLGGATWLEHHPLASVWLGIGYNEVRRRVGEALIEAGHPLLQAIHPFSWVSPRADVGAGVVVFAGAAINTGASVGLGAIVNTNGVVEHDAFMGAWSHLSPNATLGGAARLGEQSWAGIGSAVLPLIHVGDHSILGAGAVAVQHIPDHVVAVGVPARVQRAR